MAGFAIAGFCLPHPSLHAEPKSGNVTVSVGDVKVTPPGGGAAVALKAGDTIQVGSTVTTGAGARAVIVMTPRSAIRIAENSTAVVEEIVEAATPPKVTIDLKDGSLGALLRPGAGAEMDFKIKTPSGIAAARGTYFAVVVENGKGFAQVKEGKVEIVPAAGGNPN
ncbi:MAG: FecR domain-containing protein [Verrucomicrobiae bacterium]|nr:FecR domain-containing protein [Verrucomicrobiae bacterium]